MKITFGKKQFLTYTLKKGVSFERAKNYILRKYDRIGKKDIRWYLPDYWFRCLSLDDNPIEVFKAHVESIYSTVWDCQEVKKEPRFYNMICKNLEIKPLEIAHVGDDWYSDFISPRKINVKSFFLDRTGEKRGGYVVNDLRELEKRLIGL